MSDYQTITRGLASGKRWKMNTSFNFAMADSLSMLVSSELLTACQHLPLAFFLQEFGFRPVCIQGISAERNLFVYNGTWVAPYTPAAYRGYPFALAQGDGDDLHLCIDIDSGLVGEGDEFDQPFFDETGEPAQAVKDVLNFLEQVHRNRAVTERMCAALAAEDLIQPWPLKVQTADGERSIEGLFRIDEARLNSLEADALYRVHTAGALPMAYCQLLSMGNIQTLGLIQRKLAEVKNKMPEMSDQIDVDDILQRHKSSEPEQDLAPAQDDNVVNIASDEGDFDLSAFVKPKQDE